MKPTILITVHAYDWTATTFTYGLELDGQTLIPQTAATEWAQVFAGVCDEFMALCAVRVHVCQRSLANAAVVSAETAYGSTMPISFGIKVF